MPRSSIRFFSEDIPYTLKQKSIVRSWIENSIKSENASPKEINFIFCSDQYLLEINKKYLNHTTYTDIVTFDNSEIAGVISGDIFISIERVRENSVKFGVIPENELQRVMIHGVLHLLGYSDKTKSGKAIMTEKENFYLSKKILSDKNVIASEHL